MIWNEELSASLDQSGGVVVFQRIEHSRSQQLAQVISEKVAAMVDQNEKTLDVRMGGTGGWGDRNDGNKNEKRGEQLQERRGRGERIRGARGMIFLCLLDTLFIFTMSGRRGSRTWRQILAGFGKSDAWSWRTKRSMILSSLLSVLSFLLKRCRIAE